MSDLSWWAGKVKLRWIKSGSIGSRILLNLVYWALLRFIWRCVLFIYLVFGLGIVVLVDYFQTVRKVLVISFGLIFSLDISLSNFFFFFF